jgi:polyisoprenoid-binding protein YceI
MKRTWNPCCYALVLAVSLGAGIMGVRSAAWSQEKSVQPAPAKTYEVDTKLSQVYVKVDPDPRGHAHGVVGRLASGKGPLGDGKKLGELVFDLTSFAADDPPARRYVGLEGDVSDSDRQSVTRTMLGKKVLDTAKYPTATYTITSITPLDNQAMAAPGDYQVDGELDLHGVKRPVRFRAKVEHDAAKETFRVRGEFSLRQTDYGITPYSALLGTLRVKNELRIYGDVTVVPGRPKGT